MMNLNIKRKPMRTFRSIFILIGAFAYGWLLCILTKNGMPDIMALAVSIVTPIATGAVIGRPIINSIRRMNNEDDKEKLITTMASFFCLLAVGIAIGSTTGTIFQKHVLANWDKGAEKEVWQTEVEGWKQILSDPKDKNGIGMKLFEKYLGKPVNNPSQNQLHLTSQQNSQQGFTAPASKDMQRTQ